MDNEQVKTHILTAWEYVYLHDDWVNPLGQALAGVSVEEALWRPGPKDKGIWDIVLHMTVWTENIVERMRTGEKLHPAEGAWPALPADPDEPAWESAKARLWQSLDHLREYLESIKPEQLMSGPWGLADLLCRFIHNAYHIGQITKMRECMEFSTAANGQPDPEEPLPGRASGVT